MWARRRRCVVFFRNVVTDTRVKKKIMNKPPITLTSTVLLFVYAERLCRFQRNIFWQFSLVIWFIAIVFRWEREQNECARENEGTSERASEREEDREKENVREGEKERGRMRSRAKEDGEIGERERKRNKRINQMNKIKIRSFYTFYGDCYSLSAHWSRHSSLGKKHNTIINIKFITEIKINEVNKYVHCIINIISY